MPILPDNPANYTLDTVLITALNVVNFITTYAAYTAVVVFIWAAIQYFIGTRSGEKGESARGKTMLTWTIVGIIIILLAKVIIAQVLNILAINNNPTANKVLQ